MKLLYGLFDAIPRQHNQRIELAMLWLCFLVLRQKSSQIILHYMPVGSIDLAGGGLSLKVPLASLVPGLGGAGYNVNLHYTSRIFNVEDKTICNYGNCDNGQALVHHPGWHYDAGHYALDLETSTAGNT